MANRCPIGSATGYFLKTHTWTWLRTPGPPCHLFQWAMTSKDGLLDSNSKEPVDLKICGAEGKGSLPKLGERNSPRRPDIPPKRKDDSVCKVSWTDPKIVRGQTFPATYNSHLKAMFLHFDHTHLPEGSRPVFDFVHTHPTFKSGVVRNWKDLQDIFLHLCLLNTNLSKCMIFTTGDWERLWWRDGRLNLCSDSNELHVRCVCISTVPETPCNSKHQMEM